MMSIVQSGKVSPTPVIPADVSTSTMTFVVPLTVPTEKLYESSMGTVTGVVLTLVTLIDEPPSLDFNGGCLPARRGSRAVL
jgi:hypothetical protein